MIDIASRKRNILIVDDDQSVTEMLSLLLKTRGYEVVVSHSAQEAFHKVSGDTDLILLDLVLSDLDGLEVCRHFREDKNTLQIPIIILSAKVLSHDIVESLYMGADDYLTKPFQYEELVARMEAVMRRGEVVNQDEKLISAENEIISELRHIIDTEAIVPFFQPIYQVNPLQIYGFEVLCRPKTQGILSNPEFLFKMAIRYGMYHKLEFLTWKKALKCMHPYIHDCKLFLNCNPYFLEETDSLTAKAVFEEWSIDINNVVLEITERSEIGDFKSFYERLSVYRDYGFKFAIDDVGGGYASLESMVEVKPECIKIDRRIVSNIEKDSFRRSLVKCMVNFCKENNVLSIAEGIETKEEYDVVKGLGLDCFQGYYLNRPMSIEGVIDLIKKK